MPRFPNTDPDIAALANTVYSGLGSDPIFSAIPVSPGDVKGKSDDFAAASALADQKRAEAKMATDAKSADLDALVAILKRVLDLAVRIPNITEAQLNKLGWSFPSPPSALAAPGQCRDLEVATISGNSVEFDWKKPVSGGKAAGYRLYRRAAGSMGAWILEDAIMGIATTRDEEHDFPPGTWDVVVTAANTTGEGPVSNTVTVTIA